MCRRVAVIKSSVTTTFVRFDIPTLVAVIVYVRVSPTDTSPLPSSSAFAGAGLTTTSAGAGSRVVSVSWPVGV